MIVLKRTAPKTVVRYYEIAGTLSGTLDESNQVFSTEYNYVPNRISVLYNGQALHTNDDFIESGPNEVTLIYLKPGTEDVLMANYEHRDSPGSTSACCDGGSGCVYSYIFTNTTVLQANAANFEAFVHPLGEQFVQATGYFKPTSGTFVDQWINFEGVCTVVAHSSNTIRVYNNSGFNLGIGRVKIIVQA